MTIALDDFQALLRKVEKAKKEKEREVGAKQQLLAQLKEEYGCETLEEAVVKLEELKDKEIKVYDKYMKLKGEFEEAWDKYLGTRENGTEN